MDLGSTYDKSMQWVFAAVASIALHVLILAAFVCGSRSESGGTSAPERPKEAEVAPQPAVQETPPPEDKPKVEAKPKAESKPKPKAEQKPKAESKPKAEPKPKSVDREKGPGDDEPGGAAAPKAEVPPVATKTYVVKRGDTLKRIARENDCTMSDLANINGVPLSRLANLRVGQRIKVPKGGLD